VTVLDFLERVFTAIIFLDKKAAGRDFNKDILFRPRHNPWFPGLLLATGSANILPVQLK